MRWYRRLADARRIEGADAVRRSFLMGEIRHYVWGALAERDLYERVPFEPGVLFEDIYACAELMARLSEAVLLDARLYGYVQRKGSICNPVEPDERFLRDNLAAIRHFEDVVGKWDEALAAYVPVKAAQLYSGLCTRTLLFGERAEWGTYLGEARRFVRGNRGALVSAVREGWLGARQLCSLALKVTCPSAWLAVWTVG